MMFIKNNEYAKDYTTYVESSNGIPLEKLFRVGFDRFSTEDLLKLYQSNRNATSTFFDSLSDEELLRRGTVSGKECTVRGLGYVIAGHEIHHLNLLAERYLPGLKDV